MKLLFEGLLVLTLSNLIAGLVHNHNHEETKTHEETEWTQEDFYSECEKERTVTCFGNNEKCVSDRNCKFAVSIAYIPEYEDFYFRLFAMEGSTANLSYVAVGLSKDDKMGEDSIVECLSEHGNLFPSWSGNFSARTPIRLNANEDYGITHGKSRYIEGNILCEFHRKNVTMIRGHEYDLNKELYILLAIGAVDNGKLVYHQKDDRVVSSHPYKRMDHIELTTTTTTTNPPITTTEKVKISSESTTKKAQQTTRKPKAVEVTPNLKASKSGGNCVKFELNFLSITLFLVIANFLIRKI